MNELMRNNAAGLEETKAFCTVHQSPPKKHPPSNIPVTSAGINEIISVIVITVVIVITFVTVIILVTV